MAILNCLTYYFLILSIYQIHLTLSMNIYPYKTYAYPLQQHHQLNNDQVIYLHPPNPLNEQRDLVSDSSLFTDNNNDISSRLNWFKRSLRSNNESNKRMLCFFHAVNCFG